MYAAGKIPGGFIKREARPSRTHPRRPPDGRPIRPLFQGLQGRRPARDHGPLDGPGEPCPTWSAPSPPQRGRSARSVQRPGRLRARRPDRRRVRRQPDLQPAEGLRARPDRRRHQGRDHDGRGGANLLPEAVMAEAILFGHRAPADRRAPGRVPEGRREGEARPVHRAPTDSSSTSRPTDAKREPRRHRHRDPGTDPKMSDLVEIAAVKIKGTKVVDRRSTFVNPAARSWAIRCTASPDIAGARARGSGRQAARLRRRGLIVGHNVGFDLGFIEEAKGDGFQFQPGTYRRHAGHRPRGPGAESYKLGDLAGSSASS